MDEKIKPEVTIKKDVASISLNQDGKINITMDKGVFVESIGEVFDKVLPESERGPMKLCPAVYCLHIRVLPDDIRKFVDIGILSKNDLTVEQLKILESIRS